VSTHTGNMSKFLSCHLSRRLENESEKPRSQERFQCHVISYEMLYTSEMKE